MNYMEINPNDVVNGEGICVSLFVSGCDFKCPGCFNQNAWDFSVGKEFKVETLEYIKKQIIANNYQRNFSVLGGEPLHPNNRDTIYTICSALKYAYPTIKIFLWTGYTLDEVKKNYPDILNVVDVIIDGKYKEELRDVSLRLRGSRNQNIWRKNNEGRFFKER